MSEEILDDKTLDDMGGQLTVVDPNYVLPPQDEKNVQMIVGEINGFLQTAGSVQPPRNYDHVGALKSFYLALIQTYESDTDKQKGITLWNKVTATPERKLELMTAAREMVMYGVNVTKNQCYFHLQKGGKYGLTMGYLGYETLVRSNLGIELIGYIVREGDEVSYETLKNGRQLLYVKNNPLNRDKPIVGAAAIAIHIQKDEQVDNLYMSWKELCKSRDKGMVGGTPAYKTAEEKMYKKLVLKALAKQLYRRTDDSANDRDEDYFVRGDFNTERATDVDYNKATRGGVTITNADGTPVVGGEVEYWYSRNGDANPMTEDMMFAPYLNKAKQSAGEKYPDGYEYVDYCNTNKKAVLRKKKEEATPQEG